MVLKTLFSFFLLIGVWVPCVLGQQCDVVVTSQAALNKELKTLLHNLDVHVDGNISCSNTCEDIAGRIKSLDERLNEILDEKLNETLDEKLNEILEDKLDGLLATLQNTIIQQVSSLKALLNHLHRPGISPSHPAASCADILLHIPGSRSGYYWIEDSPGQQYCDMTRSCGGVTGGWRRVAELDMTNSSHQCPSGLRQRTDSNKRTCVRNSDSAGCSSVTISTAAVGYSRVCGKITAYQVGSPDAFGDSHRITIPQTIDIPYVDGVSLTHGSPRHHIWTFAAALDEVGTSCHCTNVNFASEISRPPAFVGNDYFCDTGSSGPFQIGRFYGDDPLWDGAGCGPQNTCCSLNNPPWFSKQLPQPTTDDIEMRVCRNQDRSDEDIAIETVEIYVINY